MVLKMVEDGLLADIQFTFRWNTQTVMQKEGGGIKERRENCA